MACPSAHCLWCHHLPPQLSLQVWPVPLVFSVFFLSLFILLQALPVAVPLLVLVSVISNCRWVAVAGLFWLWPTWLQSVLSLKVSDSCVFLKCPLDSVPPAFSFNCWNVSSRPWSFSLSVLPESTRYAHGLLVTRTSLTRVASAGSLAGICHTPLQLTMYRSDSLSPRLCSLALSFLFELLSATKFGIYL